MTILGLDIGGANLKAADGTGIALSQPFAIWKHPDQLAGQLLSIISQFPGTTRLAVTMTAELADCFETKSEGVVRILDQVAATAIPFEIWTTAGRLVSAEAAMAQPMLVAAANWHALATWLGRTFGGSGQRILLIDIGTTTTDIISIIDGAAATLGLTDLTRLMSGELCYSGVKRTPLCAVAHSVPFRESYCPLAAEVFATTLDVYLLTEKIAEDELDCETANGQPATRNAAHDRIARMLCADRDEVTLDEVIQIARFLADVQRQRLAGALNRVLQRLPVPFDSVIVSGSGSFLARQLIADHPRLSAVPVTSLDQVLSPAVAEAACAHALAQLAASETRQFR